MPGRVFRPKVTADYAIQAVPLAPTPPDDTAALHREALRQAQDTIARLRGALRQAQDENAAHLRSIALWREIAESEHGDLARRLVHAEHKCGMLRFLLFSAWVRLGEKAGQ